MALTAGGKRVTLTKLTPRDAKHCKPFSGRPLFQQPRQDAAVHKFMNGVILFIAAGPDDAMEAVQVAEIRLEDGTSIEGCSRVEGYLGLTAHTYLTATITGNKFVLTS